MVGRVRSATALLGDTLSIEKNVKRKIFPGADGEPVRSLSFRLTLEQRDPGAIVYETSRLLNLVLGVL